MPQLRRAVPFLATALLLILPVAPAPAESADQTAAAPIEALDHALIEIMQAGRQTPFQQRADILAPIIDRAFDLPEILKISVGPGWSALPAEQQAALLAAFRRYTIASYVDNFDSYDGQRFAISPTTRPLGNGREVVDTQIIPKIAPPRRFRCPTCPWNSPAMALYDVPTVYPKTEKPTQKQLLMTCG